MRIPDFSRRGKTAALFTLLGLICLAGAQCGGSNTYNQSSAMISPLEGTDNVTPEPGTGGTSIESNVPYQPITDLVNLINQLRSSKGLSTVQYDGGLATAAQLHTNDMISQNYFALVNPQGIDVFTRYVSSSYQFRPFTAGQYFIAQGTTSGSALFHGLRENPSTYAVLTTVGWNYVGVGYNPGNGGTWTVFFSN